VSHVFEPVRLALFGDSLAAGVGATSREHTLGPLLSADLTATGVPVEHRVFAVSGARSAALAGQVAAAGGWPRLAVVVVGANDLAHFVPVPEAVAQLTAALGALRADGVEVVLVPVPDLGVLAAVPVQLRDYARAAGLALRTAQVRAAESLGVHVVDTTAASELFAADPSMFSADRFHPSSAGYREITAAVAPVLRTAARALRHTP
jgi:lysophospholipase L1-like esterase